MQFCDEDGDATKILSRECYEKWVSTRKQPLKQPQESFRRVLTAHVCGMDGRRAFPEKVETSLLKALRKREVWECFRESGVSIGIRGFRNTGFHEANKRKLASGEISIKKNGKCTKKGLKRQRSVEFEANTVKRAHLVYPYNMKHVSPLFNPVNNQYLLGL